MKLETTPDGGILLRLSRDERVLLRYALERATFTDTPAEVQKDVFLFADDLLKALREAQ